MQTGDAAWVVAQARALSGLSPAAAGPVGGLLAQLAEDAPARRAIAIGLADNPLVLSETAQAARNGLPPSALLELVAPTVLERLPDGVVRAQAAIAGALVREGRFAEARRTWRALAGNRDSAAVFDGGFEGSEGAPPFAWTLHYSTNVQTIMEPAGGTSGGALAVTAHDSLAVKVAEQSLTLAPGPHRLRFSARGGDDAPGRAFAWTLSCHSNSLLAEIPIDASPTWRDLDATVVVPSDSPMQILRLGKLRTPNAAARAIRVDDVSLARR